MFKLILLPLFVTTLSLALEISINTAKENHQKFSILHINNDNKFACQAIKDEFKITTKVVCAFSKNPRESIKELQNDFFQVTTLLKKETFFLVVNPFYKIELIPVIIDLTKDETIYQPEVSLSKHWMVIGYKEKKPLINNRPRPDIAINFPYYSDKDKLPYVGGLDLKGNPVYIKKVEDVSDYLKIKKFYKEEKYEYCMELIEEVLLEYPNTLFKAELIFYKIKAYSMLKDYENVIENAKVFLREYSSDENIPEVLSLIANAYSKIGLNTDAEYFFDRLFSEHEDSLYAQWGYIYLGEMLEESGRLSKAIEFYKKALKKTESIDVGASAAYHLASAKINNSLGESQKYVDKILQAKPNHFAANLKRSIDMMNMFAEGSRYEVASAIAKALLEELNVKDDLYEVLLKNRALWLAKTKKKSQALSAINEYLKIFSDGEYIDEIQIAKDELFFYTSDLNTTAKLEEYDKLIREYIHDSIGDRAVYEKAKLLLENKMYRDVLDFKREILKLDEDIYKDIHEIITQAAIGLMKDSLQNRKCHEVLKISNEYNITLSNEWDDGIYECAMKGGDYQLSKKIASKNLKSKSLEERKKWLYRYIKIDFAIGNYSDVIDASKDLITLLEDRKTSKYKDVYRYLFDAYERVEKKEEMISSIREIQKIYGLDYKDLDRYCAVMRVGSDIKDDNIVIEYAKEAMKIQKSSQSNPQSPFIEFTLYQAYINKQNYNKALEVIQSLDNIELNKSDRARQKYLLGAVYSKLWRDEEAMKAYEESIKADSSSVWAKLAQSAKEI